MPSTHSPHGAAVVLAADGVAVVGVAAGVVAVDCDGDGGVAGRVPAGKNDEELEASVSERRGCNPTVLMSCLASEEDMFPALPAHTLGCFNSSGLIHNCNQLLLQKSIHFLASNFKHSRTTFLKITSQHDGVAYSV